jgi:hypothetical protein
MREFAAEGPPGYFERQLVPEGPGKRIVAVGGDEKCA